MSLIPYTVLEAWDKHRLGPCSLATTGTDGTPNVIYAGTVGRCEAGFLIANYHLHKTLANLQENPLAALLFITEDKRAYQLKGTISFHSEGTAYETMLSIVAAMGRPDCHSVALLTVASVYCGAEQLA